MILLAGRMAIPQEIYEAAEVDGATGIARFAHVTFPLLANLYLVCTLLSTIFTLGDFNTVYFVTGGGPALSTHVLATLGIRDAFELAPAAARRGGGDVGAAADDPAGDHPDAQAAHRPRCSYERDAVDHGRRRVAPGIRACRLRRMPRQRRRRCSASCC